MTVMTSATNSRATSAPGSSSWRRLPAAFRLQFSVPTAMIGVPILVFMTSWVLAMIILLWIRIQFDPSEPLYAPGATQSTIWAMAFMAAYSASHSFPFSLALSYSRRIFAAGAYSAFAVVSAGFGLAFALAAWIEELTGGFGLDLYTYNVPFLVDSAGVPGLGVLAATVCLFFMMVGFFWAILYRRVTLAVLWTIIVGLAVIIVATILLISYAGGWSHIGAWFLEQTTVTMAAWLFGITVVLATVNYAVLRRAT